MITKMTKAEIREYFVSLRRLDLGQVKSLLKRLLV